MDKEEFNPKNVFKTAEDVSHRQDEEKTRSDAEAEEKYAQEQTDKRNTAIIAENIGLLDSLMMDALAERPKEPDTAEVDGIKYNITYMPAEVDLENGVLLSFGPPKDKPDKTSADIRQDFMLNVVYEKDFAKIVDWKTSNPHIRDNVFYVVDETIKRWNQLHAKKS